MTQHVQLAPRIAMVLLLLALPLGSTAHAAAAQEVTAARITAALPKLETLTNQTLAKTGVPGLAIAVVYKDEVVYLKGFGVREVGKPDAIDPDTVFQLASVSKPIASTIVAGVVGDGQATWDDPIIQHDPDFQMMDPSVTRDVTLRDMFAHRSGLPEYSGDLLEDLGFDQATILRRLRYLPTADHFRAQYAYTNFGLTEAAVAAAKAAGKAWPDLADQRLYQPLGMDSTSSRYADYLAAPNRALVHVRVGDTWVAKYQRDPESEAPAGGVSSTVRDLAQWMRLQLGGGMFQGKQVINAAALAETHRPQIVSDPPQDPSTDRAGFYGLGWNVSYTDQGAVQLGHSGAFNLGVATAVYMLPADDLGIMVLTNGAPIGVPETVALSFLDLARFGSVQHDYFALLTPLFAALGTPPYGTTVDYAKPPAQASPAASLDAYVATYTNSYFGDIQIVAQAGGLSLVQGANHTVFPMTHYDRDVFSYQPTGESAYGPSGVTFTVGADGKASSVVIENLNIYNTGTFSRAQPPK
jgi:CubicO group peptidase (beta-lactamase class C family)